MEFSAEEFETALITPNNTLADIHMPLLKVSHVVSFSVKEGRFSMQILPLELIELCISFRLVLQLMLIWLAF